MHNDAMTDSRLPPALAPFALGLALMAMPRGVYAGVQPLAVPEVQEHRLSNGVTVLIFENHQVPYAAFRFLVKTGSLQDPEGLDGAANLATTLLTYGTTGRTEQEINETVDLLGASLSAAAGQTSMQVYGDVTTVDEANLRTYMDLFADVIRRPTFPEGAVARVKTRQIGAIQSLRDNNSSLAERAFTRYLYGDHPYGRHTVGQPSTVERIERADLATFHHRYFVPEHAIVGVAGDVDPQAVLAWAEAEFGDAAWGADCPEGDPGCDQRICQPGPEPQTCAAFTVAGSTEANRWIEAATTPQPAPGLRVIVVDKADPSLNQVQWRLGHPGLVKYTDPDWYAWRMGTQVLGGDFTARLNQVLRVQEGLTYGARLTVGHDKRMPGRVGVSTYVKPADVARAVQLTLAELEKAVSEPMSDVELTSFQSKLIESLPFRFETAQHILSEHIHLRAEGLDAEHLRQLPVKVAALEPAEIRDALARGLDPTRLVLVAVGNASLADSLRPLVESRGGTLDVVSTDSLFAP
jgi:zinc protease